MLTGADGEGFIEHAIKHPKLFLVVGVTHAALFLAGGKALLVGALARFAVLVGELAADAVGHQAVEIQGVGEGVALAVDAEFWFSCGGSCRYGAFAVCHRAHY